ncbi:MAG: GDSL-type esterase/lipase family protein [Planctomycetota bacterium]|nr:GDSL-type esterase/lipase family protein [Planctomycetota bacterium]
MKLKLLALLMVLGLVAAIGVAAEKAATPAPGAPAAAKAPAPPQDPSVAAIKAGNDAFLKMHESFLKRGKEGPIGLLFIGDSITQGWGGAKEVWSKFYDKYQAANFGIGGDRTQHVLWRIENGELDGISPKVVVLMIGTNNTGGDSGEAIAKADCKIVEAIRAKLPKTKVLVLGIFPRGDKKTGELNAGAMVKIKAVNAVLAKLDDGKTVRYLDLANKFIVDGKVPMDVMPDQLHLSAKGYQIWAETMQPLLEEMMK